MAQMESSIGKIFKVGGCYFKCFEDDGIELKGITYVSGSLLCDFWYKPLEDISFKALPENVQEIFSDPLLEIEYWRMKG